MKTSGRLFKYLLVAGGAISLVASAAAKNLLYTPDNRVVEIKGGTYQPDLSMYRSPLESKVVDRRFITDDATYAANEEFKFGMEGFNDLVKAGFPVAYHRAFEWITVKEMYFYARYVLDYVGARGHAGINMVQGPYWTMKAHALSDYNRLQRDRGEVNFSNKSVMLGFYLPMVYQRTGFPRVFDDTSLTYLQYKSVDPHFAGHPDNRDNFDDPMSGKRGGWGQPNTYINNYEQRFDHDKMDTTFDLGAIGQFVKRRMQWSDYFFHSEHNDESTVSRGKAVPMLGNDAEEGLRGWALAMGSLNAILAVKSEMFTDGKKLLGIDPSAYDPAKGLRYIPHEVKPSIMWVGDMPERVWSMDLKDNSSELWDQASWIWGTTAYAMTVVHRPKAFTDNPPVDGGLIEASTGVVAEALTNAVFKNIEAMHLKNGILVSRWTPDDGTGTSLTMRDAAMTIAALHDMAQSWDTLSKYSDIAKRARTIIKKNGDFLLKVQGADGSFHEAYSVTSGAPVGANNLSAPNWAGIRALLAVYFETEDTAYLTAARKTFNLLNRDYWDETHGLYRTRLGDDTVTVRPYDIGIALAAMREMLLATPTYMANAQIERVTRWWIQTVNQSGVMQAENERTGEIYTGYGKGDDDGDGIPYAGKVGIAPLMAAEVAINIGGANNSAFAAIDGDQYNPNRFSTVRTAYRPKSKDEQLAVAVPLENPQAPDLKTRQPMEREDGTIIPLQPSKPIVVGLGTVLNLTGRQIFETNCSICHGQHGEGIDGLPLEQDMNRTHDGMYKIVYEGRFAKFMPPWGVGNEDGFDGTLTKDELDKVVDYVQSDDFKHNYQAIQSGKVIAGSWPKDVWFYLSRENVKAHGELISAAPDAERYISQFDDPAKFQAPWYENIPRIKPDAEISLGDRDSLMQQLGISAQSSRAKAITTAASR